MKALSILIFSLCCLFQTSVSAQGSAGIESQFGLSYDARGCDSNRFSPGVSTNVEYFFIDGLGLSLRAEWNNWRFTHVKEFERPIHWRPTWQQIVLGWEDKISLHRINIIPQLMIGMVGRATFKIGLGVSFGFAGKYERIYSFTIYDDLKTGAYHPTGSREIAYTIGAADFNIPIKTYEKGYLTINAGVRMIFDAIDVYESNDNPYRFHLGVGFQFHDLDSKVSKTISK